MKKIALAICFMSFLFGNAFSQGDFRFGIQASPSFSWMGTDDNTINSNGTSLGLRLGMVGEYYFAENYAFTGGLNFAFNQGGTLRHDTGGNFWTKSELSNPDFNNSETALPDGVNLKYSIQFVEIPIGLKMRTQEFGYLRYYAELPIFTIGIKTQAVGDITGTDVMTEKENIKSDVNPLNISWGLGGGIEYTINSSTSLVGGVYYSQGFLDLTTDQGAIKNNGSAEDSKGTSRNITIRIGVLF